MPELGPYGSVRGARGNSRPYRESDRRALNVTRLTLVRPMTTSIDAVEFERTLRSSVLRIAAKRMLSAVEIECMRL